MSLDFPLLKIVKMIRLCLAWYACYFNVLSFLSSRIRLIRHPESLTPAEHTIVQEYISEPFLVDGFKCDMRIYVLVTKCMPLRVFIFNEGLLRLSTEAYSAPTDVNLVRINA